MPPTQAAGPFDEQSLMSELLDELDNAGISIDVSARSEARAAIKRGVQAVHNNVLPEFDAREVFVALVRTAIDIALTDNGSVLDLSVVGKLKQTEWCPNIFC